MLRTIHLVLIAALLATAPAGAEPRDSDYVLIVAQNRSLDVGVPALRFADDDGARYWELFSQIAPRRVSLLAVLDPDTARTHPEAAQVARVPWMRELRAEVQQIRRAVQADNRAGRRTRFTFIYVGHGNVGRDGEGYVSLQDLKLRRQDLFREIVDAVPAGAIHLIIDACKSYFLVSRGPEEWRDDRSGRTYGNAVRAFLDHATLDAHPHVGVIVSTSGDEEVHEWSALHSGVFSHQLRSALSGGADINGDGRVEYSEVGAFIAAANQRVTHQRARLRPFLRPPAADRHAALFEPRRAAGPQLELEARARGRFSLEDDRGVRWVDLNKALGSVLRLALPADRRYFILHNATESVLPAGRRGVVRLASLGRSPARSESRGSVDLAYRSDLFAVPLSFSFYEGYLATTDLPTVRFATPLDDSPTEGSRLPLRLDLGYGLSPVVLDMLGGLQHSVALGARIGLRRPLYLAARAELGVSSHEIDALSYRLLRVAVLGGAGLSWRLASWIELALQLDVGYQALVQLGRDNSDTAGAKVGSQVFATLHPWSREARLGLTLRFGYYGNVVTVAGSKRVYALPEGGLGVSWAF
jgi:hypothetical protein